MDRLENAIDQLDSIGIRIDEKTLARHDSSMKGLYVHRAECKPIVMIDSSLPHSDQLCVLAEEAGVIATVDNWIVHFDPYFTIYQE